VSSVRAVQPVAIWPPATVKCAFSIRLPVFVGYKVFEVDHDHNGHVHGTRLSGVVVGMTYRF
jgi:predicted porin